MEKFVISPESQENNLEFKKVSASKFIENRNLLEPDLFAFLSPHTEEYYLDKGTSLYLSNDCKSGFGINPDGELISVFSLERSRGKLLVQQSRQRGAKYLSCMGEKLLELYSMFGFKPVTYSKWDDNFAPMTWNYDRFGKPNVYEMKIDLSEVE